MNVASNAWNDNQRRGYILAREFLFLQFYVWGALGIAALVFVLQDSYDKDPSKALSIGLIAFLATYFPIQYIRVVYAAWRIWKGYDQPPEVTAEQEKDQQKAAQEALNRLVGGA